jgi:hypothetical protein
MNESAPISALNIGGGLLLVIIFALIGFVALRVVTGNTPAPAVVNNGPPTPDGRPRRREGGRPIRRIR